jgi:hypothetical protein
MDNEVKQENTNDEQTSENLEAIDSYLEGLGGDDRDMEHADGENGEAEASGAEADGVSDGEADSDGETEKDDSGDDDDSVADDDTEKSEQPDSGSDDEGGETENAAEAEEGVVALEDLIDSEEVSDETWAACQALFTHFSEKLKAAGDAQKHLHTIDRMQTKIDELEEFVTVKRQSEYVEKFEAGLDGLGNGRLFGEGGFDSISQEQKDNRLKIDEHVQVLRAGYKESGKKVPPLNELIKMSFKTVFESPGKPAETKPVRKKITRPSRSNLPANSVRQENLDAIDRFVSSL